jgi:hypothetical protein
VILRSASELKLLDYNEWVACQADIVDSLQSRALRSHWGEVQAYYPRGFQKFLNSIIIDVVQTDKSPRKKFLKLALPR